MSCGRYFVFFFDICDLEERRYDVWNQSFIDCDTGRTAEFQSFFSYVMKIAHKDTQDDTLQRWKHKHSVKYCSYLFRFTCGWSTWFPLLFSCRWEPREQHYSEVPCCSAVRHPETYQSTTPEQTHSQLDDPTSHFLVPSCSNFMTTKDSLFTHAMLLSSEACWRLRYYIFRWVLISSESARSLLALLVKTFRHVKLRSPPSFGRKQKKTHLWLDVGVDIVPVATRNLCWSSVLLQMKRTIL